ncbi:unnamed protein product [Chrysodeixis includens]|uniref:Calphotin-like n=1 Tax=Chrysodeixis includens TaxID=689277 RepID=A0A9N8Q1C2_CHRIL|nr:unnamed protein product [Chrysodeixis includens]
MKYFVAIALIATVASAAFVKPTGVSAELAEIQEIIAAINSPSTNPATAAALEEMLLDVLGVQAPIVPSPVIVDPSPIAPVPVVIPPSAVAPVPVVVPPSAAGPSPVAPSPVGVAPAPVAPVADASGAALVQIILNINEASAVSGPVAPAPPEPVQVVESAPVVAEPVQVVEAAPVPAAPVQVIEIAPEPVIIGAPIIPSPAVNLPAELN